MIRNNARIALDIDEPADVELLLEEGQGTRAFAALSEMGFFERVERIKARN